MEYKDYVDKIPDTVIKKLNEEYSKKQVETLSNKNKNEMAQEKLFENNLVKLYSLISKSSAFFKSYKNNNIKVESCCDINLKHKQIIKTLSCCNDFSIYDGYLVPRYLNMNRCYCDHYICEMDILKTLFLLLLFKNLVDTNIVCQMCMDRIDIINSLVLQK